MSDLITLVGTIVDHGGAIPLEGARITATPSQRVTQTSDGEEALSDASATTDETGAFTLPLVYAEGLRYTIVYRAGGERLMRGVLDCDSYAAGATVDVADLPPIAGVPPSAVETLQAWFLAQLEALGGGASPEGIQDVVGAMIVAAGGTYDDEAGTITLPSSGGGAFVEADATVRPDVDGPVIFLPGSDTGLAVDGDIRIYEIDAPFVESTDVRAIVRLTQAEYDALDPVEADVLYLVTT